MTFPLASDSECSTVQLKSFQQQKQQQQHTHRNVFGAANVVFEIEN